jgi:hypothetical protein
LKPLKPPFEPPTPETAPTMTRKQTAAAVAAGLGLVALEVVLGGLLEAVLMPLAIFSRKTTGPDMTPLLATIGDTSAPVDDTEGNVQCSRCNQFVPYATMSLNEDGYFCATCAAQLTREAGG